MLHVTRALQYHIKKSVSILQSRITNNKNSFCFNFFKTTSICNYSATAIGFHRHSYQFKIFFLNFFIPKTSTRANCINEKNEPWFLPNAPKSMSIFLALLCPKTACALLNTSASTMVLQHPIPICNLFSFHPLKNACNTIIDKFAKQSFLQIPIVKNSFNSFKQRHANALCKSRYKFLPTHSIPSQNVAEFFP